MIVKMNGEAIAEYNQLGIEITKPVFEKEDLMLNKTIEKVNQIYKNGIIPASIGTGTLLSSTRIFADTGVSFADRFLPLIKMVQEFALPVGIAVATWGLIEVMIGGFGSGKQKIKYAVVGYIGIFIIPEVFYAVRDAFHFA